MTGGHVTIAAVRRAPSQGPGLPVVALLTGFLVLLVFLGKAVQEPSQLRLAVTFVAAVFLVGVATRSPVLALLVLFFWLVELGMTRRLVTEVTPITHSDPLLLVSPLILVLLAAAAIRSGALRQPTVLTKGVLILSGLSLLGAVNPLQGSLVAGISGLLFVLVPMLAFWVGRQYVDDTALRTLLKFVGGLGVLAAVYGLIQTLDGFPSWDQRWVNEVSYASLNVNGVIRPFAMFSSSAEYGMFIAIAIVVWLVMGLRVPLLPVMVGALAVLVPALVLESSRGVVLALLVTIGVLIGARSGLSITYSVGAGVLLLVILVVGLRHYVPTAYGPGTSGTLLSHQVEGLSDPLDPQTSTANAHLGLIKNGIRQAFSNPIGHGLGAVTIAGAKFGGLVKGTEADPSNVGVALGLPGLIAYLTVFFSGLSRVYKVARVRRDALALAALGVVVVTALQWLNGGQYAVAILPWIVLGWVDKPERSA
jgi:hypothetical protein